MFFSDICEPIATVEQLLNRHVLPNFLKWCDMVEPLKERSTPRLLGKQYFSMDGDYVAPAVSSDEANRPELLVCHDYKGNYLDDKYINGTIKWEEYRFYNWQAIDIFCYFSHNLVTIPTLQFLNAAHLNGVKVIGTLIVEGSSGQRALLNDILSSKQRVEEVADSLVEISKRLKFEGWLLNVEVEVDVHKIPLLMHLVEYLTQKTHEHIPQGRVIWYDSVTEDGKLLWQNELNTRNE